MKKLMLVFVSLIALAGFGYWFWSLGAIQSPASRSVELIVQQQGVQVKAPGSETWQQAGNMQVEKGWTIKTDESGLATVRFYDQGETRLDRNSEMTITEATSGDRAGVQRKVEVTLNAGRVWSRVLRLLDIDSSYAVRTSEVVATVRGTAFGMEKSSTGTVAVSVGESAVTVASAEKPYGSFKAVGEGTVALFASTGVPVSERLMTDEDRSSGWAVSNEMADQALIKDEIERRVQELKQLDGPRPDSPLNGIASLSERVHLALANDATKNVLLEQYLSRRLYHLIELVQAGKTGLAAQEFTRIENDLQAQRDAKKAGASTDYIRMAVLRIALLTDQANPSDALYPFKQRVERLFEALSSSSDLSKFYARLLGFDARLDEAVRLIDAKSFDSARTTLDGVKSGVENVRRDSASLIPSLTEEYRAAFEAKLSAISVRQQGLRARLDAAMHPLTVPNATSTQMEPEIQSPSSTQALEEKQEAVSIVLTATPNQVEIGQRAKLTVKAIREDGTEQDVTAFAMFASIQYVGKLNGPSYVATAIGKDEITAQYKVSGKTLTAKTTIETKGEIKLMDLVISSSRGASLDFGETTVLTATARYNNGATKNVTDRTSFIIISGGGIIQNTIFSNDSENAGETTIAGTYRDGDLTAIGSIKLSTGK